MMETATLLNAATFKKDSETDAFVPGLSVRRTPDTKHKSALGV